MLNANCYLRKVLALRLFNFKQESNNLPKLKSIYFLMLVFQIKINNFKHLDLEEPKSNDYEHANMISK